MNVRNMDFAMFHEASKLAFVALKYVYKKPKVTQEDFEFYSKLAVMYIKTRHDDTPDKFRDFCESISFPKIENIKKLNLFDNLL